MIKMLRALWIAGAVFAMPLIAFAEEGEKQAEGGIPMSVTWQAINFIIYIGILVYVLRLPVKTFFKTRHEEYEKALVKADQARKEAERRKHEIEDRLAKLENSSQESLASAKAEAGALVVEIQRQAEESARRMKDEAARAASSEIERAKSELRQELMDLAIEGSKRMLEDKMKEPDQKRLQTEFVEKVAKSSRASGEAHS